MAGQTQKHVTLSTICRLVWEYQMQNVRIWCNMAIVELKPTKWERAKAW
ncbi:hypothetical protein SAMN00808754_2713 [Thermanaeromonas toyohensis ToBE]|uniref:Uncharacterized protein n=1 Tax=Thermanaeromonas toyohensis ToBE TaxID=698762 RepID=A0A1W1W0C4_9FIRM|nr:hypothetical protein SAMN00808754_2713 [Thermanaeromonas toyohensis ToBE]